MKEHYTVSALKHHPGYNPDHVIGGYVRYTRVPADPKNPLGPTVKKFIYPPNPSRWNPHVRGMNASDRDVYKDTPVYSPITRQQRRHLQRTKAKQIAAKIGNGTDWRECMGD